MVKNKEEVSKMKKMTHALLCTGIFIFLTACPSNETNKRYFNTDGAGTITAFTGPDTSVVIPVQINSVPVT